jgi:hypothetical protein
MPTPHATSVQAPTRRDMAREGKSGKKYKSAREMQNSSIAHIGIGSTLEDDPEPAESLQVATSRPMEIELQSVTLAMHRDLVYAASILDIDDWTDKETMHDESYSWINQGSTAGYFYQN